MGIFGDAFNEGWEKGKKPGKTKAQKLAELRKKRALLDSKNKLSREYRAEKSKYREAKLESFGLDKAKRKKIGKSLRKFAAANQKRFGGRRKGKGGSGIQTMRFM